MDNASPAVRAELYEAAAGLEGVESLGAAADHAGRRGVGLALADRGSGTRIELVFDPCAGALLGARTSAAGPSAEQPPGTVVGWAVCLEMKVVDVLPPAQPGERRVESRGC
jgi:hypothetical protein